MSRNTRPLWRMQVLPLLRRRLMPRSSDDYSFIIYLSYFICVAMTIQHVDGLLLVCLLCKLVILLLNLYYCDACFGDCLCDVLCIIASVGISFLSLLNKPQMPPRRANPNPNNNNNNITPEMQQMMTTQTQLMQMMTTFIQNQNNNNNNNINNNNNNNNNPPGFDMLTRFLRLRPAKFSGTTD